MKKILFSMALLLLSTFVFGQAQERQTPQSEKKMNSAAILLPYSPQVVYKALENFVSKQGKSEQKKAIGYQLSESTLLDKNNIYGFDKHFFYGLNSTGNPNETALYLNLESSRQNDNKVEVNQFDMQQAKDYLNNLAIAITPYATDLQLKLQNKNLVNSQAKGQLLVDEGIELNKQQAAFKQSIYANSSSSKNNRLTKRLMKNKQKIDNNIIAQANQNNEITKQKIALALLVNTTKA
jgi:hypothetical protein